MSPTTLPHYTIVGLYGAFYGYDSRQNSALVHLYSRIAHELCWSDQENKRGVKGQQNFMQLAN